jgi:hypothetical protein
MQALRSRERAAIVIERFRLLEAAAAAASEKVCFGILMLLQGASGAVGMGPCRL